MVLFVEHILMRLLFYSFQTLLCTRNLCPHLVPHALLRQFSSISIQFSDDEHQSFMCRQNEFYASAINRIAIRIKVEVFVWILNMEISCMILVREENMLFLEKKTFLTCPVFHNHSFYSTP